jgi:hypothetical protein
MHSTTLRIAAASAGALILAACSSSSPSTAGAGRISFNIATRASTSAAPLFMAAPDSQVVGEDTLVFESVQIVLRKIDLERTGESVNCADQPDGMSDGHEDACEEVNAGPSIIDLPLTPGPSQAFTVSVDTGTFKQMHLQIHVLTDNPGDQALLAQYPDFAGISIQAKGSYKAGATDATEFMYTNDLTANQELEFASPLTVGTAGPVELTLMVDVHSWFLDGSGNLIDPATAAAGEPNEGIVTQNIRRSFHAFEDENHDGCDDHNENNQGGGDNHGGTGGGGDNQIAQH